MKHEHGALIRRHVSERVLQLVTVGDRARHVADRPRFERRQVELDRPTFAPTCHIEADIHGRSVQPGIEPSGIAQPGQVAPDPQVCVLDRVLRELGVAQDEASDGLQMDDRPGDELSESVCIPPPSSLDEIPLIHGSLS